MDFGDVLNWLTWFVVCRNSGHRNIWVGSLGSLLVGRRNWGRSAYSIWEFGVRSDECVRDLAVTSSDGNQHLKHIEATWK